MPIEIPGPAYRICTRRLVVRCWHPADAPLLSEAVATSLDHLRPWMAWIREEPKDLQRQIDWLRQCRARFDLGQDLMYGIFNTDENLVIGGTGLHSRVGQNAYEIGYWIRADAINKGLATETAAALTKIAFEVDRVARVEIHCNPENVRSAAVPKKLGFTYEATLRQRLEDHEGHWEDSMIWSLLAKEYPTSAAFQAELSAFDAAGRKIL
ncbi:MAG: hypothetical protein Kow00121_21090 [Elainellaceae cyanobacterium]